MPSAMTPSPTRQSHEDSRLTTAAAAALDSLRAVADAASAAGDLTPALDHWTGLLHTTGSELLPRVDALGPTADDARSAIAQAATHARTALAKYLAFPVESRRIAPGSKWPTAALLIEPSPLKSPHAEAITQIRILAQTLAELAQHTDLIATRGLTAVRSSTQDITDLVAAIASGAAGEYDVRTPPAAAPAQEPTTCVFPRAYLAAAGIVVSVLAAVGAGQFHGANQVGQAAPVSMIGSPADTASPTPTGTSPTPWTPQPAGTEDALDLCAGLPVPDVRFDDYRERWVRAGYPLECLDPLPFDGAVGPDADAARTAYAAQHPDDPVYASDAPLSVRVWKRIRKDASAAASSWASRPSSPEGTGTP